MRKHKSVVAILLAVMMIFTFMPTMAFATDYPAGTVSDWSTADKYAKMKDSNGHEFSAKYYFGSNAVSDGIWNVTNWDGIVAAKVADDDTSVVGDKWAVPGSDAVRYFYDFDGSAFVVDGKAIDTKTFNGAYLMSSQRQFGIQLVAQNYGNYANYAANKAATKTIGLSYAGYDSAKKTVKFTGSAGLWNINVVAEGYDTKKTSEDQTVKFSVEEVSTASSLDAKTDQKAQRVGTMPTATVTIKGVPATVDTAKYYFDTVGEHESSDGLFYDGTAHKVVATPVDGWTVSYKVYDKTKGDYVAKDAVELTNVETVKFVAVWKKTSTGETKEVNGVAKINAMSAPTFKFDADKSVNDTLYYYNVDGTEYNAVDYVVVAPYEDETKKTTTADETARLEKNAASKAAVEANKSEIMNYFADFYEIKEKTLKSDVNYADVSLEIKQKSLTATEKAELEKKYETLMKNFGLATSQVIGKDANASTAKIWLNADKIDEEIEFTQAISSKVVHVKKAKKLKKAKTFTVKAISNKGRTVAYKLVNADSKIKIDKTSGKITLKKGLKKGTYKFYVKAYVPGHLNLFETQYIVVKVKK